jgi:hypothetical protein
MAEVPPTRASLLVRLRDPRDEDAWREFVSLYGPRWQVLFDNTLPPTNGNAWSSTWKPAGPARNVSTLNPVGTRC